jgi:hypothetical protein
MSARKPALALILHEGVPVASDGVFGRVGLGLVGVDVVGGGWRCRRAWLWTG